MPFKAPLREASNDRSCASFRTAANLTKHFCSIDTAAKSLALAFLTKLPLPLQLCLCPLLLRFPWRAIKEVLTPHRNAKERSRLTALGLNHLPTFGLRNSLRKDHGMQRFPPGLFFQQLLLLLKSLPLLGGLLKHKSAQAPRHAAPAFAPWWPSPATHMLSLPYGQATSLRRMTSPVPMPNIQPHARPA